MDQPIPADDRRDFLRTVTTASLGAALGASAFGGRADALAVAGTSAAGPLSPALRPTVAALGQRALEIGACTLTPQSTSGPFYFDTGLIRQDITEGKPGVPMFLFLQILDQSQGCAPIPNAVLDVWQCDALGTYSGYAQQGTQGETYLRGIQLADANGIVMFQTIFPGAYPGRATHVHLKARPSLQSTQEITGQLYFDDLYATVINQAIPPYDQSPGTPTLNANDGIYVSSGGDQTTMPVFVIPGPPVVLVTGLQITVP